MPSEKKMCCHGGCKRQAKESVHYGSGTSYLCCAKHADEMWTTDRGVVVRSRLVGRTCRGVRFAITVQVIAAERPDPRSN